MLSLLDCDFNNLMSNTQLFNFAKIVNNNNLIVVIFFCFLVLNENSGNPSKMAIERISAPINFDFPLQKIRPLKESDFTISSMLFLRALLRLENKIILINHNVSHF